MSVTPDDRYSAELEPALLSILAPFEEWAKSGYVEGIVDFLPIYRTKPYLVSPSALNEVFEASLAEFSPDSMDAHQKAEAAARFEFANTLMNLMMTREAAIRDRYYAARKLGMIHRTAVLFGCMAVMTASIVSLPEYGSCLMAIGMGAGLALAHLRFNRRRVKIEFPDNRAEQIIAALPWQRATADPVQQS